MSEEIPKTISGEIPTENFGRASEEIVERIP